MLPILVIPEHWYALLARIEDERVPVSIDCITKSAQELQRTQLQRTRWRQRCALNDRVTIYVRAVRPEGASQPRLATLIECERLVGAVLRHQRGALPAKCRTWMSPFARSLQSAMTTSRGIKVETAAWLLWAMSWRGVSTLQQLFSPQVHPPTLMMKWWNRLPESIQYGNANTLLRLLYRTLTRTYRFWLDVARRMRRYGRYLWDPHLIDIRFAVRLASALR